MATLEAGADPRAQVRARTTELVAFAEENRSLILVLFGRGHEAAGVADEVLDALTPGIEEGCARASPRAASARVPRRRRRAGDRRA